jgi:hypothetical protein
MRKDKEFIFKLRHEGKSYRDIQKATGVSRGTLCRWFEDQDWSAHLTASHSEWLVSSAKNRMERLNLVRKLKFQYEYALAEAEATKEYKEYKDETLFSSGLAFYISLGDKLSTGVIMISSADFYVHRMFASFCQKYLDLAVQKTKYQIVVYEDNDQQVCVDRWALELGISKEFFLKNQLIKGRKTPKTLQFGTCRSIISSTVLKKKLMKWISLAKSEQN